MASSLAYIAVLSLLSSSFTLAQDNCAPCEDVHFFLARGNNEPYPGRQAALVSATCSGLTEGSCGYEDLIYSALYTDLSCQTTYDGALAGRAQMTNYAARCPNSKLVLAGYSQGAQIVTDILGGGGGLSFNECLQPSTPPLDRTTSPGNKIAAVIAFGNTRHTGNQPYNYGNGSALNGLYPRTDAAMLNALDAYADITRDWCLSVDPICAANQTVFYVSTHLGYYNSSANGEAAAWIKQVASLTKTADFTTSIPLSLSGTAQNYATIPSGFVPGGTVTQHATTAAFTCSGTALSGVANAVSNNSSSVTLASSVRAAASSAFANPSETAGSGAASASASGAAATASSNDSTGVVMSWGLGLGSLLFAILAL